MGASDSILRNEDRAVVRLGQRAKQIITVRGDDDDIESAFSTPHDDPPGWVVVLTAYLDESSGSPDGFYVVGGYLGNDTAWRVCSTLWKDALAEYGLSSLHLKELRLGSNKAEKRHGAMLEHFGKIPAKCGLYAIYGSVTQSDYTDLTNDTNAQIAMDGYPLALWTAIPAILRFIPPTDRLKLVFEQQIEHAAMREIVLSQIAAQTQYRTTTGSLTLAGWESLPASTLFEPADYLCYAVLQNHIDKQSQKARLTRPILDSPPVYFSHMDRDHARMLVNQMGEVNGGGTMTKQERKETMRAMRDMAAVIKENPMAPDELEQFNIAMTKLAKATPQELRRAIKQTNRRANRKRKT